MPYDFETTEEQQEELDQLVFQIGIEEKLWIQDQLTPQMIGVDGYFLSMQMYAMWELVRERFDMSTAETEIHFKKKMLEKMRADHKFLLKARKEHERANIAVPDKRLLGPNGTPMGGAI